MAAIEELNREAKPYIGTLVINDLLEVVQLLGVEEDDDDFYWVFDTPNGICQHSCVGTFVPLKGNVDDNKYNRMVSIWNLNNCSDTPAV